MSWNSAPPSRRRKISSTRCWMTSLVDLPLTVFLVDPGGVPVVQGGVVEQGELLDVSVRPQVRAALENQLQLVGEAQGRYFRVTARRGNGHAAGLELADRF